MLDQFFNSNLELMWLSGQTVSLIVDKELMFRYGACADRHILNILTYLA